MKKVKPATKPNSVVMPSVHSCLPQVSFRNMGPDERTVRLVYDRAGRLCRSWSLGGAAPAVLVEPVPEGQLWDAELRLAPGVAEPIRTRGPSPDLAVQRAFDELHNRIGQPGAASTRSAIVA